MRNVVTEDSGWHRVLIVLSGPIGTMQQECEKPPCNGKDQMTRIKCNGTVGSCILVAWPGSKDGMIMWNCEEPPLCINSLVTWMEW
jgi:hypothetical protein